MKLVKLLDVKMDVKDRNELIAMSNKNTDIDRIVELEKTIKCYYKTPKFII